MGCECDNLCCEFCLCCGCVQKNAERGECGKSCFCWWIIFLLFFPVVIIVACCRGKLPRLFFCCGFVLAKPKKSGKCCACYFAFIIFLPFWLFWCIISLCKKRKWEDIYEQPESNIN